MCVHLTETFIALNVRAFRSVFGQRGFAFFLGPAVAAVLTFFDEVKRRRGDVDVAVLNQAVHVAEEESQHQRGDVAAVDVGIGHDNHLAVAQFFQAYFLFVVGIVVSAGNDPERFEHVADLFVLPNPVFHRFLDIQDFTAQRHDRLECPVASLLGGSACRVALDEKDFGFVAVA